MRLPPAQLVAAAVRARRALEIGAGSDFSTSLALAGEGVEVTVSDLRAPAAPPPLRAIALDVTRPGGAPSAGLVYAVRVPEELQAPCARLADALGADLALRALKDEWADLAPRPHVVWPDGWRFFPL